MICSPFVAPLAGAWIEIDNLTGTEFYTIKSLPLRERGLKCPGAVVKKLLTLVAPLAGAWIEISHSRLLT